MDAHLDAASAAQTPFVVHLRGTGTFRPVSPVVFIGVVAGISCCKVLSAALRSGPLSGRPRFPYHPHVTIAHGLPDHLLDRAFAEQAAFDARYLVDAFSLYEHTDGGWRVRREIPLRGQLRDQQ